MGRANVLRSVHRVLESHEPLRSLLEHTPGASTVSAGARIVGDSVRLESLPLPILILGFEAGDAIAPQRELAEWGLEVLIYAEDVFSAAELLDLVEEACLAYRFDPTLPEPLAHLKPGPHQRLEPEAPQGRIIATRLALTAKWT